MAELRAAIEAQASRLNWAERPSLFRLPIDRCFTIQGHGTIVTGSLMGGEIAAQEEVELMPQRRRVRVRRAESHGEGRDEDNLSRRVALNLPGIKTREIRRGMELAAPGYLRPTTRLAVELRCLRDAPLVIDGERAHRLHIGTEDVDARFALIGVAELEPGARCFAIAQTQREICATHGQRFIVRSPSHGVTIGGGRVVATAPPKVRLGSAPEWMNAWANGGETERILAALEIEPTLGADPVGLHRETGVSPERSGPLLEGLADSGRIRRSPGGKGAGFWTADYIDRAKSGLIGRIQAMLEAAYPRASLDRGALLKGTASLGPNEFVLGLIEQLKSESKVREREGRYYLEGFQVRLRDAELEEQNRLIDVYAKARFAPPKLEEAIARLGLSRDKAAPLYRHAVETGALIELNGEIALHRDVHDALLESLRGELAPGRGLTVSEIKQIIGVSRKFAVPICEHLDRKGFTRRQGDLRFAGEKLAAKAETETAR
jgi:selenocysteine-specific elongation factor